MSCAPSGLSIQRTLPETAAEKAGLQYLLDHADSNYYSEESLGGRRYFTAVYADRAIVPACVQCHNRRPDSPKKDFKLGDIMGGMVVRVPLEFSRVLRHNWLAFGGRDWDILGPIYG